MKPISDAIRLKKPMRTAESNGELLHKICGDTRALATHDKNTIPLADLIKKIRTDLVYDETTFLDDIDLCEVMCLKLKREKRRFDRDFRSIEVLTDAIETLWRIALKDRLTPKVVARVYNLIRAEVLQFSATGKKMAGFLFRDDTLGMAAKIAAAAKAAGEENKILHSLQTFSQKNVQNLKTEKRRKPFPTTSSKSSSYAANSRSPSSSKPDKVSSDRRRAKKEGRLSKSEFTACTTA